MQRSAKSALAALKRSRHVHSTWYRERYPDVDALGMDPAEHYLRYGADMGRNPGKHFDTNFYLRENPEVLDSGLNPLVHYALEGESARRPIRPSGGETAELAKVAAIRQHLYAHGHTSYPLKDLQAITEYGHSPSGRACAARELALWAMREKNDEGFRLALDYLALARRENPELSLGRKISMAELLCHYFLGQTEEGAAVFDRSGLSGEISADTMLAWSNFQPTPERRLLWINEAFRAYRLPEIALLCGDGRSPYDRLMTPGGLAPVREGPKVTVLLAVYESAEMLPTALRSLMEQTWRNLEIIVIDDCSPTTRTYEMALEFAGRDARIHALRLPRNGGAYVARNFGLERATGDLVTLHDADDWSHALKIETQVKYMIEHPAVMGCTSEQARCGEDLTFGSLRNAGGFVVFNTSSFMWRRNPLREVLGYWDTVRFGADSEFIRRMQVAFGPSSYKKIATGPLSLQRESVSSITRDPVKGLDGAYYGVRKEYYDAQRAHHRTGRIRYDGNPERRPFPVPPMMLPERASAAVRRFGVIITGDFGKSNPRVNEIVECVAALRAEGKSVALVECYRYAPVRHQAEEICAPLRAMIDGDGVTVLVYGETAEYDELIEFEEARHHADMRYRPIIGPANETGTAG
jgi:glycosyltransferase involved in cell wall biosynthesis